MERVWQKFYGEHVPKDFKCPQIPIHELLEGTAKKYPNNTALIFFGNKISYRDLQSLTNRFASALSDAGLKQGDRIALILPNCPEFVISYFAALKLGAIVVPTNPLYSPREMEYQLKDCGAEIVVVLDVLYNKCKSAIDGASIKTNIITSIKDFLPLTKGLLLPIKQWFEHVDHNVEEGPGILFFKKLLDSNEEITESATIDIEDVAVLQYTGGTTGTSLGVMLTHKNVVSNAFQARAWTPMLLEGKETVLVVLPLFHIFALTVGLNLSILIGASLVLLPQFKIKEFLRAVDHHKVTYLPAVPSIFVVLNNSSITKKYKMADLKFCISGGAGLPKEVSEKFEKITSKKIYEAYGLSEASPGTHVNPISENRRVGTIGLPIPGTDSKIVKGVLLERSQSVDQEGELVVSGPQVMKGYWSNPEETKKVLKKGWLHTGDMAKMDEDGYFRIVGRKKEMILVGGNNVYPLEIEDVLYEMPEIQEAAIIGLPDKSRGEYVKAFVVLKEGASLGEEALIKYCKEKLSHIKIPRRVEFRKELPKSLIGKIMKRIIKEEELKKIDSE